MKVKKIFSKEVIDTRGNRVGRITDMDVDMDKGVINHITVSTGFFSKHDMKLDKIQSIGDTIILKIRKEELTGKLQI